MKHFVPVALTALFVLASVGFKASAQSFPTEDPVITEMWRVGIEESRVRELGHVMIDQIGPRLAGSEGLEEAQNWLVDTYGEWGVEARLEEVGTWKRWEAGRLHVDMVSPRVSSLEAEIKAWSPGTDGVVRGEVVMPPSSLDAEGRNAWLSGVSGKFVLMSAPEEMCRAMQELEANARPHIVEALQQRRRTTQSAFFARMQALSGVQNPFRASGAAIALVDSAGALGTLESRWSGGWGVNKVFATNNLNAIALDLSCEDYGLLHRLVESGQTVEIEVNAEAEIHDEIPQFNVIAEIPGTEKPDEYVILGAHLDSWHAATGATDNGTGSLTMLEAMRILRETYPNPKRTILAGHWANEEMGLIGSGAFREDHPEMADGIQVVFNQDNGTWFFERIEGQGFTDAAGHVPQWMAALPREFSDEILLEMPGVQNNQGSDHTSFVCAGIPAFRLQSPYDEYRQYTWHTNRDTYDKIVFDDLRDNATVAAMLAYMASEDPDLVGRERASLPPRADGRPRTWSNCRNPRRSSGR